MRAHHDRPISLAEARALMQGACNLAWFWELQRIAAEVGVHLDEVITEDLRLRAEAAVFVWRFGREQTMDEFIEQLAGETGCDEADLWGQLAAIEAGETER